MDGSAIDEDLVDIANSLMRRLGSSFSIEMFSDCNDEFFAAIYEKLVGEKLAGLKTALNFCDRIENCQLLINTVARDILDVDLSHITGEDVISGDKVTIGNLLEIFVDLMDLVSGDERSESSHSPDRDGSDSDILTEEHDVISDVISDEFGEPEISSNHQFNLDNTGKNNVGKFEVFTSVPLSTRVGECRTQVSCSSLSSDSLEESNSSPNDMPNRRDADADSVTSSSVYQDISTTTTHLPKEPEVFFTANSGSKDQRNEEISSIDDSDSWNDVVIPQIDHVSTHIKSNNNVSSFGDIGLRPRQPLPGENDAKNKLTAVKGDQIVHQHTHFHYHGKDNVQSNIDLSHNGVTRSNVKMNDIATQLPSTSSPPKERGLINRKTATVSSNQKDQTPNYNTIPLYQARIFPSGSVPRPNKNSDLAQLEERLKEIRQSVQLISSDKLSTVILDDDNNADYSESDESISMSKAPVSAVMISSHGESSAANNTTTPVTTDNYRGYSSDPESPAIQRYSSFFPKGKTRNTSRFLRNDITSGRILKDIDNTNHGENKTSKHLVRFKDDVRTFRDERLYQERIRGDEVSKKTNNDVVKMKQSYSKDFQRFKKDTSSLRNTLLSDDHHHTMRLKKEATHLTKKAQKKNSKINDTYPSTLSRVYGRQNRPQTATTCRSKKRSASSSPVGRRRLKAPLNLAEDEILPVMQDEFPFLYMSPQTAKIMWHKQMRQLNALAKCAINTTTTTSKVERQYEMAHKKQEGLMRLVKKELDLNKRMLELKKHKDEEAIVVSKLRQKRHASARARKYYDEYQLQMKSRMMQRKTKEEKIFKNLFADALDIQKQRVQELREFAKEQRERNAKKQQSEIESIENYYRDQFEMLTDDVLKEREELKTRQKAQTHVVQQMRSSLRKRMEHDIETIQGQLIRDEDNAHFRQLDADALRQRFKLATYRTSKRKDI